MRHRLLSRTLLVVLACFVALPAAQASAADSGRPGACSAAAARVSVSSETVAIASNATLCLLNRERTSRGLRALKLNAKLSGAARAHSADMVKRGYFEHNSRNGRSPFDRMLATRYVPRGAAWTLGENIGWGTGELASPAALVKAWMKSPSHRANVLNGRFREIGIGVVPGVPMRGDAGGEPGATYTTDFGQHS